MDRIRVLFLAANPDSTTPLHAGREVRKIRERLAQAKDPRAVEIVERWAVRPGDLQHALIDVRPHIVHFSGHGSTEYELMLEGDDGSPRPVGKDVLAELFRLRGEGVRLVVLSACHSLPQAEAIAEHVDCAIGMRRAVGSEAAAELSAALYHGIASGDSIQRAFESARLHLKTLRIPEDRTPQLVVRRDGVESDRIVLSGPRSRPAPPQSEPSPSGASGAAADGGPAASGPGGPVTPGSAASGSMNARPGAVRAAALVLGAAAIVAAGAGALSLLRAVPTAETALPALAPPPAASAAVPAAPPGADALEAYAAGQKAWREGNEEAAKAGFERAIALDPSLGAAHLRLALARDAAGDRDGASQAVRDAMKHRSQLGERDAGQLGAVEPCVASRPFDHMECAHRLQGVIAKFPDDAELRYRLGRVLWAAGEMEKGLASLERALALDPSLGPALVLEGHLLADAGDLDAAVRSFDRCWRAAPESTECLYRRGWLHLRQGDCNLGQEDFKSYLTLRPGHTGAIASLAAAELQAGRPIDEVRAALAKRLDASPAELRGAAAALADQRAAWFTGDFSAALARAQAGESVTAGAPDRGDRSSRVWSEVLTRMEIGQSAEAGRVAADFLEASAPWARSPASDPARLEVDRVPSLLSAARDARRISQETFSREREAWVGAWEASLDRPWRTLLWLYAHAAPAASPNEARGALEILPKYGKLPAHVPGHDEEVQLGRAFLLAGRLDEALLYLRRATASCTALLGPIWHTRGFDYLGQALEAKGDKLGACDAYAVVLQRWGGARPRSITAEHARGRARVLGCKR